MDKLSQFGEFKERCILEYNSLQIEEEPSIEIEVVHYDYEIETFPEEEFIKEEPDEIKTIITYPALNNIVPNTSQASYKTNVKAPTPKNKTTREDLLRILASYENNQSKTKKIATPVEVPITEKVSEAKREMGTYYIH